MTNWTDSVDPSMAVVEASPPLSGIRREVEQGSLVRIGLAGGHRVVLPTCVLVRRAQSHGVPVLALLEVLGEMYGKEIPLG